MYCPGNERERKVMTPRTKIAICCASGYIAAGALAERALAHAPGDFSQYFRGVSIGDPLGAAPPPGLYFENTMMYAPGAPGHGQVGAFKVNAVADIPTLYWSTGWSFLGASVAMAISQPFYQVAAWPRGAAGPPFAGAVHYPALHNTWINPLTLSWNFKNGWFVSTSLAFYVPDGSKYNNSPNPDYWSFEPSAAISYLADGWNLTTRFVYNLNAASAGHTGSLAGTPAAPFAVGYRSGDQAYVDLTATKKFEKWEIGPVGYLKFQLTDDRPGSGFSCATMLAVTGIRCGRASDFAVGALVGYDFGPVVLKAYITDSISTKDDFGGVLVWTKLLFRVWGPDAAEQSERPRPLIRK
jgi:hypothetical protein